MSDVEWWILESRVRCGGFDYEHEGEARMIGEGWDSGVGVPPSGGESGLKGAVEAGTRMGWH